MIPAIVARAHANADKARRAVKTARRRIIGRDFVDHLELVPSAAGLHIAAVARSSAQQIHVIAGKAARAGVQVQELTQFAFEADPMAGLVLGYGAIATSRIAEGMRRLRRCMEA